MKKPVTLITGYLGSGKTTLMNELLRHQDTKGLALIVNDMGSVNVDAEILKKNNNKVSCDTKLIEMQNGCICCTLLVEFMDQIKKLAEDSTVERIMVEASGISNPAGIANGFLGVIEDDPDANVYLESVISVVDADRIHTEFLEKLKTKTECDSDEEADITNLVVDQIEFCSVILLNKCDLLNRAQLDEVHKVLRSFQKEAEIIECIHGKVDPSRIFNQPPFDFDKVLSSSAFQQALEREQNMSDSGVDEYGVSSFVYEDIRPFDREKFMHFIEKEYPKELIRAKGYMWFKQEDSDVQLFEQAGRNVMVTPVSNWVAAFSKEEIDDILENNPDIKETWNPEYGDRLNQIVFIGKGHNKSKILAKLAECVTA